MLLVQRPKVVNSLFLFIEVFGFPVWLTLIGIIIGTSIFMYAFDRIRIHLEKEENKHQNKDNLAQQFTFSDTFWYIIGSFTVTGGINPPKSIAISLLVASFWFLSAICLSTYQANLSAFLTGSRLQTQSYSIEHLAELQNLEYSVIGMFQKA